MTFLRSLLVSSTKISSTCFPAHLHVSLATVNRGTVELVGSSGGVTLSLEGHVDNSGRLALSVVHHSAGGNGANLGLEVVLVSARVWVARRSELSRIQCAKQSKNVRRTNRRTVMQCLASGSRSSQKSGQHSSLRVIHMTCTQLATRVLQQTSELAYIPKGMCGL